MSDKTREILAHVAPTVVRRRVVDMTANPQIAIPIDEDDEEPPPSSIDVGRALASLRAGELKRLDAILDADDILHTASATDSTAPDSYERDEMAETMEVAAIPAAAPPTLTLGKEVSISGLAQRMGMNARELTATLVARGFYTLNPKSVVSRDTARLAAQSFGYAVAEAPEEDDVAAAPKKKTTTAAAKPKKKAAAAKSKSRK